MTSPTALPIQPTSTASRTLILVYGVTCYFLGLSGLLWLILGTLGLVPTGVLGSLGLSTTGAVLFNVSLVALFGIQHAIMARPRFKRWWTTVIPAATERSTFVVIAGGLMALIMAAWQPTPGVLWSVEAGPLFLGLYAVAGIGWTYMLLASFMINHFELFGLQQVWRQFRGQSDSSDPIVVRGLYQIDRHPIMTGVFLGLWGTPHMDTTRLVLALAFTTYMVVGVAIEERTLVEEHGEDYETYRGRVPALFPLPGRRA